MSVEPAYDTSTPAFVILRNAVMGLAFVIFALLTNSYMFWTLSFL